MIKEFMFSIMNELIHIAEIQENSGFVTLFLRKINPKEFKWFKKENDSEIPLEELKATSVEQAFYLARRVFKNQHFQPLACGYRFTLPERDEHGNPALFSQMSKSLNSPTGIYFDDDLGHNCIVQQIPMATRRLFDKMKFTTPPKM